MTRYYIDACVWRDYFEDRRDNLRPLGEWAFQLLRKIVDEEDVVVISDNLLNEFRKYYDEEKIIRMLSIIPEELILRVNDESRQLLEARELSKKFSIHRSDALHLALALLNDAVLVTRDAHFKELKNEYDICAPEELI
ncbi:MAG: PIN domain-containing protein [archaeon]